MGDVIQPEGWRSKSEEWKDMDDMRVLMEAITILLQGQVPQTGDNIGSDTPQQRQARLMHIELKKRLNGGKSTEQRYREALELIRHNAEKLMPEYEDEKALVKYMNGTKNPVLKKMYAIRQYCTATLEGREVPPKATPPKDPA